MPNVWTRTALALVVAAFAARTGVAQDVQYKTVTKMHLGGGMNVMLKLAGASETSETSYLKGKKMRTDLDNKTSTIYDLDGGRYIHLNHENRTYTSVTFAQMFEAATAMASSASSGAAPSSSTGNTRTPAASKGQSNVTLDTKGEKAKLTATDSAGNKADFTFDLKVDNTSERKNINGNDAQRTFMTVETDIRVTPEGESQSTEAGKLIMLMDVWNSVGGPAHQAVRAFEQAAAKEVAQVAFSKRNKGASIGTALGGGDPKMSEAMKKASEEAAKMEGVEVLSTTHFVAVPAGMKFDRDLALKAAEASSSGGGAGGAVKRGLGGALRGALGAKKEEPKPASNDPRQATFARMTTEIRDVQTTSLPASLFEVPAGYTEIKVNTPAPK